MNRARQQFGICSRSRGFSLLELVVVVILIAFLVQIAIARLLALQAEAERVAMDTVVGTLRSALGMKVAESLIRQETARLPELVGTNPMDRLTEPPRNYLGELTAPDLATLEDGTWYYDRTERMLVYLVRNSSHFSGGAGQPPRARFAVKLVFSDRNANGRFDRGVDSVEGLSLSPVEPFRWVR